MTKGRSALLGACLALPFVFQAAAAGAAQPKGGHYVYVPAGATVVVLPSAELAALPNQIEAVPVEFPVIGMFAQQDRMMRHMMADMDSLLATPMQDPQRLLRDDWGVEADVWSATSWTELRRNALAAESHNLLHPDQPLELALRFLRGTEFLPVVHRAEPRTLLGVLSLASLLATSRRASAAESPSGSAPIPD